jgi:hypothetical protein
MKRIFLALALTLITACPALAQTMARSSNAVFFTGTSAISSQNMFTGTKTPNFFMSFWYNLDQRPTSSMQLFSGQDASGTALIEVTFFGDPTNPYIEVDAIDDMGQCAHLDSKGTDQNNPILTMSFDGKWHNVILDLNVIGGLMYGEISFDGNVQSLSGSADRASLGDPSYAFHLWNWPTLENWLVGGSYTGNLAEFYVELTGSVTNTAIKEGSPVVDLFREPSSGKAVGLGVDGTGGNPGTQACTVPGNRAPAICLRGAPCNFVLGPISLGSPVYVFSPVMGPGDMPIEALSDPCHFTNDDFIGKFCPEIQKPLGGP